MRLLSLRARNLFSIGDISIPLDKRGLVLVTGYSKDEGSSNGAGKSSVASKAIIWTLFGQTPGGLRADDVINRHIGKGAVGTVEFIALDGKTYAVTRSRNPNTLEFIQDPGGTHRRLSRRNERDTQELINHALGRDVTTFLQADFFGQGRSRSYPALTPKEQKEVLEQILPISKLTECWETAKTEKKVLSEAILSLELESRSAQGKWDAVNIQTATVSDLCGNWETDRALEIQRLEKESSENLDRGEAMIERIAEIEGQVAKIETVQAGCREKLEEASSVKMQWSGHMAAIHASIIPEGSSTCPMCEQPLPNSLPEAQGKLLVQHSAASTSYIAARKAEEFWMDQVRRANHIDELTVEFERLHTTVEMIKASDVNTEIRLKEAKGNPYEGQLVDLRATFKEASVEVEHLKKEINSLQAEADILSFWVDAFSKDLRNYMLAKACPFLEAKTNAHLQGLGNPQLKVKFSTVKLLKSGDTKEDFNVTVESDTGGIGFASLSGGEQQMISFAVGLALSDLAESQVEGASHFLVLDEPFTMLDGRNSENLVHYLTNTLGGNRETILLISNADTLKSLIPNRIHVVKENGISRLETPHV